MAIGHTINDAGERQDLEEHLRAVAVLAAEFCSSLGAREAGYYLGLWHDVGKFHPRFQAYLIAAEAGDAGRGRVDHKAAGARLARDVMGWPFSMIVAGHHGGLQSKADWDAWLRARLDSGEPDEALELARRTMTDLTPETKVPLPPSIERAASTADVELFLRLIFSALVDGDSLDTERHYFAERAEARGRPVAPEELWPMYEESQRELLHSAGGSAVMLQRRIVYEAALAAAEHPPGVFRMTVPTGGGKTRSSLGFALRHAMANGQRRVIVAMPFLTVTDQTSDVFRSIFDRGEETGHVLEDHSGVFHDDDDEDLGHASLRGRLAAENWDAPIVVTTTVQLFESMFANRRNRCRKLHRLANSVIVLDEAQALPSGFLRPMLDALRELTSNYNTSIVLSTATQPAFEAIPEFAAVPATEIVADSRELFAALRRVSYEWQLSSPMPWSAVAGQLREERQVLVVVNTKRDAVALLDELRDPDALLLSAGLCGMHRRAVLADVRRRMAGGEACRLVSTQVVEAGVDLDFPVVFRAIAPLGSVIQAAGRCNREGRLTSGRVVVFDPLEGGLPGGVDYRIGTDQTRALVRSAAPALVDADDPQSATSFFRAVYQLVDTDRNRVQAARAVLDYPSVASRFKMIEPTASVVVRYPADGDDSVDRLVARLKDPRSNTRRTVRALQPYLVSMPYPVFERRSRDSLIEPLMPGLGRWLGRYDPIRGLVDDEVLGGARCLG